MRGWGGLAEPYLTIPVMFLHMGEKSSFFVVICGVARGFKDFKPNLSGLWLTVKLL